MLDENCLLTWEGALAEDVHDHDDGDDDGISVTGLKVIFVFALMAEDIVGGLIGIFAPRLFGDKAAYVFALFNMFGCVILAGSAVGHASQPPCASHDSGTVGSSLVSIGIGAPICVRPSQQWVDGDQGRDASATWISNLT